MKQTLTFLTLFLLRGVLFSQNQIIGKFRPKRDKTLRMTQNLSPKT